MDAPRRPFQRQRRGHPGARRPWRLSDPDRIMHKTQVPQDAGMAGSMQEITYAVDEQGRYTLVPSLGWEPKLIANRQAWREIADKIAEAHHRVQAGELSPLAFHMARHQMTPGLLARYAGIGRWRVRRHLKPAVFARLGSKLIARYASILGMSAAELQTLPPHLPPLPHQEKPPYGN